jgi:hypothetical protein
VRRELVTMDTEEQTSYRFVLYKTNLVLNTETVIFRSPWWTSISFCKREAEVKKKDVSNNTESLDADDLVCRGKSK